MNIRNNYFKAAAATAVIVAPVALFTPTTIQASEYFPDVKETDYYYDAVVDLYERGVLTEFANGAIRPNQSLTRGQTAQMIADALGLDTYDAVNPELRDLSPSHPNYGAIAALAERNIISGYEDGTFRPNAYVQRHHMAKFLTNAYELQAYEEDYLPFRDVPASYKYYVAALYENDITTGKTATMFNGSAYVTRGQLATFIVRAEQSDLPASVVTTPYQQNKELTVTVKNITNNTIQTSQGTYRVDEDLQQLFRTTNRNALQGAQLVIRVANNKITQLNSITFNNSNSTFDIGDIDISGHVSVNADNVTLKNISIKGNLLMTNEVTNSFAAHNITVDGNLEIGNQASSIPYYSGPTISLKDSIIRTVYAQSNHATINSDNTLYDVRVMEQVASLTLNGHVQLVTVNTTKPITIQSSNEIEQIAVNSTSNVTLSGSAHISEVILNNSIVRISLQDQVYIKKLTSPYGRNLQATVLNYSNVRGQIGVFQSGTLNNYLYNGTSSDIALAQLRTMVENLNIKWEGSLVTTLVEAQRKLAQIYIPAGTYVIAEAGTDYNIGNVVIRLTSDNYESAVMVISPNNQTATNKYTLQNLITNITNESANVRESSKDGTDISINEKWTIPRERQLLQNAVMAAQAVVNNTNATQLEVDNAYTTLQLAISRYTAAQKWGIYSLPRY